MEAAKRPEVAALPSISEVAPARHPLDADGNDGQSRDLHDGKLLVTRLQQRLRPAVLGPVGQDLRPAAQHDPGEPPPVLVVMIEDDGRLWILEDVAQPLQGPVRGALGLAIDGDVERVVDQPEADRHDMWRRACIGSRQMADPSRVDEVTLARRQHDGTGSVHRRHVSVEESMDQQLASTLYTASTWVLPVLLAITLHEASHGFVAHLRGDDTA